MGKSTLWLSLVAVVVSFAGGFMLANAINRTELNSLRTENDRLKKESTGDGPAQSDLTLTSEEIRAKIAEADANPANFAFQKSLGFGLYRYGRMKEDAALLAEASRLLARANQLNPKDYDVTLGLGHAYFDTGFYGKQNSAFEKAREFYQKALSMKPADVEVQTEIAMTYFLLDPPDYAHAIPEFEKSLKIDPKHEKTLQFLGQSFARSNRIEDAEKMLAKLREIDPADASISELTSVITQAKSGQTK